MLKLRDHHAKDRGKRDAARRRCRSVYQNGDLGLGLDTHDTSAIPHLREVERDAGNAPRLGSLLDFHADSADSLGEKNQADWSLVDVVNLHQKRLQDEVADF